MELSTFDFWYLSRELLELVGGRIQKIYVKEKMHVLQIYNKKLSQVILVPNLAFISNTKITFPKNPGGYCLFLRKRLQGFPIEKIELVGFDRIIKFTVTTKEGPLEFVVELLGDINSMVVKDGKIISALTYRAYADRNIRGGLPYMPPPGKPAPWDQDISQFIGIPAGKAVATEIGLGGKWSDEVIARTGIDKTALLTEENAELVKATLLSLRDEPLAPIHTDKEAFPFPFVSKKLEATPAPSFAAAIDAVAGKALAESEVQAKTAKKEAHKTKQQSIIDAQKKQLRKLDEQIAINQRAGEAIYENYSPLQELLAAVAADWKKHSFKEIVAKYSSHPLVREITPDGNIVVELPDPS